MASPRRAEVENNSFQFNKLWDNRFSGSQCPPKSRSLEFALQRHRSQEIPLYRIGPMPAAVPRS